MEQAIDRLSLGAGGEERISSLGLKVSRVFVVNQKRMASVAVDHGSGREPPSASATHPSWHTLTRYYCPCTVSAFKRWRLSTRRWPLSIYFTILSVPPWEHL